MKKERLRKFRMLTKKQLINLTVASFDAERMNDFAGNLDIIDTNFTVVDMMIAPSGRFSRLSGMDLRDYMKKAFQIRDREFIFKTIVADVSSQTVVVEFIESYPDKKTNKTFRTPQVAICKFKNSKLYRTRHYMDPRLSYEYLDIEEIESAML